MSRTVVIWSGGLDSTICLYLAGLTSSKSNPVVTYSIRKHYLVNSYQTTMQTKARNNYLRWARARGHFISPVYLDIAGNIKPECWGKSFDSETEREFTEIKQRDTFSSSLVPYFNDGDTVAWGWKNYEVPERSFFKRLKDLSLNWQDYKANVEHICPLQNLSDDEITNLIRSAKIPSNCFYCCDQVSRKPKASDKMCECQKCMRMRSVFPELGPISLRLSEVKNKIALLRKKKEILLLEKNGDPNKNKKILHLINDDPLFEEAYRLLGV